MIKRELKKANVSAAFALVSLIILIPLILNDLDPKGTMENIWTWDNPIAYVFTVYGLSFLGGLFFYARAKGYWGIWGILCAMASVPYGQGLIISLLAEDRAKDKQDKS